MYANTGTANGMAKSLLDSVGESCTAFNAALAIIRGKYPFEQKCVFLNWSLYFLNQRSFLYLCVFVLWQGTRDH